KPDILRRFLAGLRRLDLSEMKVTFLFIDDNTENESSELLREFASVTSTTLMTWTSDTDDTYVCTEEAHMWKESLVWKVAAMKDHILTKALADGYTHVFLIDSDLIVHPRTLHALLQAKQDIVSNI